jgi:DNA-binding HxlR family transcriptional regulator
MLVKHKKTFKEISDSEEKIVPSILSARLKLLELYKLIFKTKVPDNKKENIYLLTEKGIRLTPIIYFSNDIKLFQNYFGLIL